jgi:hypothetical protein
MDEHSNEWIPWHSHSWQIEVINTSLERLFQGLQNEHLKFWIWNFFLKVKNHQSSYQIIYEVYQTNC